MGCYMMAGYDERECLETVKMNEMHIFISIINTTLGYV